MHTACQALWFLLRVVPWLALGAEASRAPDTMRVNGRQYNSAVQWAQASGFEAQWLQREERLQLTSAAATVILKAESREATVNGVQVWLSLPVVRVAGSFGVSQLDLRKTLLPLLAPPRNRPGEKLSSICIDAGHGGRDPGNLRGTKQEKEVTLGLARQLRETLSRSGFKTLLTRGTDRFIELPDRIGYANRRKADLFICLHFNSAVTSRNTVQGAEVYCLTPAGASSTNTQRDTGTGDWCAGNRHDDRNLFLAYQIQKALTTRHALADRGVRRARFAVLRDAAMPAVLVEAGFMSHPAEGRRILTAEYQRDLARAIADGILAYKRELQK
jgi:N-acetylmuramoyl-L-alanine amidase